MQRGPKEKKERALGVRLQLKGERCQSPKCAMVRKPYKPGAHGQSRHRKALSDFGRQLMEKQKCKVVYGITEKTLRQIFQKAQKQTGSTSEIIVRILESRLDNVVFRLGFAPSRSMARQLVRHGHIMVNGRKVTSPSFETKNGQAITVRKESMENAHFKNLKESLKKFEPVQWLQVDAAKLEGKLIGMPSNMESPFEVGLVVESFSK